jgi:hypothetical protein
MEEQNIPFYFIEEKSLSNFITHIKEKHPIFLERDRPMLLSKFQKMFGNTLDYYQIEPSEGISVDNDGYCKGYTLSVRDCVKYVEVCTTQVIADAEIAYLRNGYVDVFLDENANIVTKLTDKGKAYIKQIRENSLKGKVRKPGKKSDKK